MPSAPCPTNGIVSGLAPRNFVRGFGAWQMDLAIRREFPIYEGLKVQFRAEAFNIFNHPNFGLPGGGSAVPVDVPGGASITNTATDNRQIEFALKYTF